MTSVSLSLVVSCFQVDEYVFPLFLVGFSTGLHALVLLRLVGVDSGSQAQCVKTVGNTNLSYSDAQDSKLSEFHRCSSVSEL